MIDNPDLTENKHEGIALTLDSSGCLLSINCDELGVSTEFFSVGKHFSQIMDKGSHDKCMMFLDSIRTQGAAFGWELDIIVGNYPKTVYFAGTLIQDKILVLGANQFSNIFFLYEELAKINNEGANLLRNALKEKYLLINQDPPSVNKLEDMSKLNNELVTLQRELAKKNRELRRLNEEKNWFLGLAAHDLRNPISTILGFTSVLLEEEIELNMQLEILNRMYDVAKHMSNLVNNLLDISVIESGRIDLEMTAVSLREFLTKSLEITQAIAESKSMHLKLEIEEDCHVVLDTNRISQVMDNLIGNAIKFSPRGSEILIKTKQDESFIEISVSDKGPGISKDEQSRLFSAFQKLSNKPTGGEKSTGLGLAIVKRIIKAHQGTIKVKSEPGKGATFSFRIPTRQGNKIT